MFRRILVPIDGSPTSNRGLEEAIALAKDQRARLCPLHIVDEFVLTQSVDGTMYLPVRYVDRFLESFARGRQEAAAKAEAKARRWHIEVDTVLLATRGRRAADLIVKQAKRWCADVIVRGTHGRRGLSRMLLGSDAEMVVREAPVPVLLVRSKRGSRRGGVKRG